MPIHSWFYQADLHQGALLYGHHDHTLMLVSILMAIAASWLGLQVAGLAHKAATPLARHGALLSGAIALGGGIWAMHFIGMLAFSLPLTVEYDLTITTLSLLPAIAASLVALLLLARPQLGTRELIIGGVLIGSGDGPDDWGMKGIPLCAIVAIALNLILPGNDSWKHKKLDV